MTNIIRPEELSQRAQAALINVGTSRMGATIGSRTPDDVVTELAVHGLIGTGNGLTKAGSIVREKLFNAALDSL